MKRKEFEGEQINYIFFTAINPHYREQQKICGTFSLERSFANFSSKKKKTNYIILTDHVSFKGLYKAAKFYSQKPQVSVPLLK